MLLSKDMLEIFDDPLAQQAKRIRTAAGAETPAALSFDACPPKGTPPLLRQQWVLGKGGHIESKAYPGRTVTLNNCGQGGSRLQLCATDPEQPQPPNGCSNTTCPSANAFTLPTGSGQAITNKFNGQCMEGMLGPQNSFVQTSPCAANNIKQQWTMHDDGTLRASNNLTDQCLTVRNTIPRLWQFVGVVCSIG